MPLDSAIVHAVNKHNQIGRPET